MTPTTTIQARRPGLRAWVRLTQAEARMMLRDTSGLIMPLGMPLLIMVMMAISIEDMNEEVASGVTLLDFYVLPVVVTLVVTIAAVINMPSYLATYRKTKVLRRLAVTPASPVMVLVAQFLVSLFMVAVGIGLGFGVALLFFDANLPTNLLTAALAMVGCVAAMYALGMFVASIAPSPNAAVAIGLVVFFAIAALGGMFTPAENLPEPLGDIGTALPFGASVEAFQSAWVGEAIDWQNWLSLGATTLVGTSVAAALFRWE